MIMVFHPWRGLRNLSEVALRWQDRDDEMGHVDYSPPCVTITIGMTQAERRCTLTHELVHLERGQCPPGDEDREELIVEREAARRLIDIRKLGETLAWAPHEEDAAEELWVDVPTLQARLAGLHPSERHYLRDRLSHLRDHPEG